MTSTRSSSTNSSFPTVPVAGLAPAPGLNWPADKYVDVLFKSCAHEPPTGPAGEECALFVVPDFADLSGELFEEMI